MSNITITLANSIQTTSLQLGDVAYSVSPPQDPDNIGQSYSNDEIKEVGVIKGVDGSNVTIKNDNNHVPNVDDFLMFSKNKNANNTSLIGYYAEVKLTNNSNEKAELYSLNSEIAESSK